MLTQEWAQKVRVLHYSRSERNANTGAQRICGPFVIRKKMKYCENGPWANVIKHFYACNLQMSVVPGELLQFSLPESTKVGYLPSAPPKGKLLAFSTIIGLGLARDKHYKLLGIFVNYERKFL
jgi:hypothetical protein